MTPRLPEAQRKAEKAYHARRRERGDRRVTVWMTPAAQVLLNDLCTLYSVDQEEAVRLALRYMVKKQPAI